MKNRKEDVIFISVLLALVLIFVIFKIIKGRKVEAPTVETTPILTPASPEQAVKPLIIRKKKKAVIWPELSYSEEFAKYQKLGHVIQFNADCQSFHSNLAIANGSSVMFDNRANMKQTVTFGNSKFILDPYDFEIMTLEAPKIPTTYEVDCNGSQNVAILTIE